MRLRLKPKLYEVTDWWTYLQTLGKAEESYVISRNRRDAARWLASWKQQPNKPVVEIWDATRRHYGTDAK